MSKIKFAIISIILIVTIRACYWWEWGSVQGFVRTMDHGNVLFGDLMLVYYPMAQNVFSNKLPVFGYYYSAFFAILISPLGAISIAQATLAWGIIQVILTGLLGIVSGTTMVKLSHTQKIFFVLLFFTSFPVLHNFKWGQVSVLMVLCVLTAMWLYKNEHYIFSGILLAFAVSIKYYPIIFITYPLLKRDTKFLFAFGISVLIFFFLIPSFTLGLAEWVNFEKGVGVLIATSTFDVDTNSQYFGNVILRTFSLENTRILSMFLQGIGGLVLLANIGTIWKIQKRLTQDMVLLSTCLLFLSLPFVIQTSWPHYFVYLPFCQAAAFTQIMQNYKIKKEFFPALVLTSVSCAMSSIFAFDLFLNWREYNSAGMLFILNFLLLLTFYKILLVKYKNNEDNLQPSAN